MLLNNEEKGEEYVAENYDKSIEELTWHLIKEQLVEANDIKVEQEDVLKMARETTKAQFAQYGMLSIPDDVLDNYAQEMLKKKETINNLVSRVVEVKLSCCSETQCYFGEQEPFQSKNSIKCLSNFIRLNKI